MANEKISRYIVPLIQAVIGSEWLRQGYAKISTGQFPAGMAKQLATYASNNPNREYRNLLVSIAIPNATAFGYLQEWLELLVGATLVMSAAAFLLEPGGSINRFAELGACAALLVGALMNLNQWLATYWMAPLLAEGNYVMGLTQVVLLAGLLATLAARAGSARRAEAARPRETGKPAVGSS